MCSARRSLQMARLITLITIEYRDQEKMLACFRGIFEALDNAHVEPEIELEIYPGGVRCNGTSVVWVCHENSGNSFVFRFKPAPGMILFVGWLMTILPSRARVIWRDGWPHIYCPPHDDRDAEVDPTPLVPNELVPA